MRVPLITTLVTVTLGALTPIAANALCEDYSLSDDQSAYLDEMAFEIEVPEGEFTDYTTMRCDADDNGMVTGHNRTIRHRKGRIFFRAKTRRAYDVFCQTLGNYLGGAIAPFINTVAMTGYWNEQLWW